MDGGKRSGASASLLLRVYDAKQAMSLADLQGPWMRLSNELAAYAYAWRWRMWSTSYKSMA